MVMENIINEEFRLASNFDEKTNKHLYGIVDVNHDVIVPFSYEYIKFYRFFFICKHPFWEIGTGDLIDIYNLNCNKIGSTRFNQIERFGEFYKSSYYDREGIVDSYGAIVLDAIFEKISYDSISNTFTTIFKDKQYDFTRTGIQILDNQYIDVKNKEFSVVSDKLNNEGIIFYKAEKEFGTGILDKDQHVIVPCVYKKISILGGDLIFAYRQITNRIGKEWPYQEKKENICELYILPNDDPFKEIEKINLKEEEVSIFFKDNSSCALYDNVKFWTSDSIILYAIKNERHWEAYNMKGDLLFKSISKIVKITQNLYVANHVNFGINAPGIIIGDVYRSDGKKIASSKNNAIEKCFIDNGDDSYYVINHYEVEEEFSIEDYFHPYHFDYFNCKNTRRQFMNLDGIIISDFDEIIIVRYREGTDGYVKHPNKSLLFLKTNDEAKLFTVEGEQLEVFDTSTFDELPMDLVAYYPYCEDDTTYCYSDDSDWGYDDEMAYIRENGGDWIDD